VFVKALKVDWALVGHGLESIKASSNAVLIPVFIKPPPLCQTESGNRKSAINIGAGYQTGTPSRLCLTYLPTHLTLKFARK
jgi:hypothetical protein